MRCFARCAGPCVVLAVVLAMVAARPELWVGLLGAFLIRLIATPPRRRGGAS